MKMTLKTGEMFEVNETGNYVYIEQAAGAVRIETGQRGAGWDGKQHVLSQRAQIGNVSFEKLRITNLGADGEIILKVGFGRYYPPQIDTVNVNAMPAVQVSELPKVQVDEMPAMEIADNQKVHVVVSQSLNAGVHNVPYTLPANAQRKQVIVKSPRENINVININGYPLDRLESVTLETCAELVITGEATDKVAILEV